VDDVKKLLEGFADRAAEGLPPADIDADVARGRRALRRIKRRRRVTGVLCVAAVSAAVLAVGNLKWWNYGSSDVATGDGETTATDTTTPTPTPSPKPAQGSETMSMFAGSVVELVANREPWNTIGCTLAPKGWTPEKPIAPGRVVLSRPADPAANVLLQSAPAARSLTSVRVTRSAGKTFHIGMLDNHLTGQVHLTDRWLLIELPAGNQDWTDELLQRFMASCTVN
jgi:hypothetical protein